MKIGLYIVFLPCIAFTVYRSYRLLVNYIGARRLKLPIVLLPISFEDAWFAPLRPLFAWVERLPCGLGNWYLYTDIGWPMVDGGRSVSRLGESFVLVTPTRNQIITSHQPAIERLYKDMKTWILPDPFAQFFTFFGQNVSSLNGQDWQRHRKITAPAFNDQNMRNVWDESLERAREIIRFDNENVRNLADIRSDFEVLAMHVLAAVGFGQDSTALTTIPPGHRLTLLDSLGFILKHVFVSIIFNGIQVPDPFLPQTLRRLKLSVAEFRKYMQESVLYQLRKSNQKSVGKTTSLLEAMVHANEAEKSQSQAQTASSKPSYLTDSELYGNLFVFNLAGFETTAGTMTFALPYLAAHPKTQDWVREEVDAQYTHTLSKVSYADTYSKLVRVMAVMYETLRLAGPAPQMLRIPTTSTLLPIAPSAKKPGHSRTVMIEPETLITADFYALHLSPLWGADRFEFKPQRFVSQSKDGEDVLTVPEADGIMYIPWVFGPRVCPGKKFSQVEFVAVVAHVLSAYKIEPVRQNGETEEAARARLMGVLDGKYFNISTHVKNPETGGIRFVRR